MPRKNRKKQYVFMAPPHIEEHIQEIVDRSGSASMSEAFRRSLTLYMEALRLRDGGGEIVFRAPDGAETKVMI